ncbi:MAG: hypothetical protein ACOYT8_03090 [Candidatus Dependentiae bacterium]
MLTIKSLTTHKLSIKIFSFIFAYSFWCFFSSNQNIQTTISVPLCFYDVENSYEIDCVEKVTITLKGKRLDLQALDYDQLAIHIDGSLLLPGPNNLYLTEKNLFLPTTIKLVNYKPTNLVALLKNTKCNNTINKV